MKKILLAIAALFCTTLSFAQEYMIIENTAGGWTSIDVSVISQAYFKTYPASGQGTKENPFNVAAANAKCKEIGTEPSTEKYYVKGIVVSVGSNSNGTAAYIADDESGTNRLYLYKLTVPEGITLSRNDEVIIYGVLYHYRNLTTEMEGELASINGQVISGDVIQTVPIADVIAGEDGVTYSVRGEVTQIANATWGNFYMKDETGKLYIYGTLDATGAPKNFASLGIEVGDIVTVMGLKKTYIGTPELVNVKVIKIEKPVITAKGSGTLSDPYNVQGVLDYINTLGAGVQSDKDIYVKGYITTIREQFSAQYGNALFTMSDSKEGGSTLTFYRGLYLGNRKWVDGDITLKEGDEVIICGRVVNYRGTTPETVQNKAYIYSLNGKTDDTPVETAGTLAKPFTPAEANAFIATLPTDTNTDKDYYIKGKLVKYANNGEFSTIYGNASFYISEDGSESSEQFYVFRTLYLGNMKYSDESWATPAVGDEVIICGKLVNYKGTMPETVANNSYIYSLNANNNGSGGGETPSSDVNVVTIADFNAAAVSTDVWYQLTGTIKNLKDGDQYGNFDIEDETGSVYVYGLLATKGGEKKKFQDLVAAKGIANGKKITIVGTRGEYNGKIEVMNAYFIKVE